MARFSLFSIVLCVVPLAATFGEEKPSPLDKDRKAIQGIWIVESAHRDGKKIPDNERVEGPVLYAIKVMEDKFQISLEKSGEEYKFAGEPIPFSLDVSASPRIIEFDFSPSEKGYCIYSIKDGQLSLGFNYKDGPLGDATKVREKLPKSFETKLGDGSYVFVLKKAK